MRSQSRTLPYNRTELLTKLREVHNKRLDDWRAGDKERRVKAIAGLDKQITKLKEFKRAMQLNKSSGGFRVYVGLPDSVFELRWPEDKPREFISLEYAIHQLEMSSARIVRLRDDDTVIRILAGGFNY